MSKRPIENDLCLFMKFGSKINLEKLRAGQLYMKNLKYYVNLERFTEDEDVGDKYDGQMLIQNSGISLFDYDTNKPCARFNNALFSINLGYLNCPVFCMFVFDRRNYIEEQLEGDVFAVKYRFTQEQLKRMPNFGDYVLIIKDTKEFFDRVKNSLRKSGYKFTQDYIQYYENNSIEYIRQVQADSYKIAFWKRDKYSYQQEYRFLIYNDVEDFLSVQIGDISDITEIKSTAEILNTLVEAKFKIK